MSLTTKQREIYVKLWGSTEDDTPIPALYMGPRSFRALDEAGLFTTYCRESGEKRPQVWIRRWPVPSASDEPDLDDATLEELLTLAHERGHARSFEDGNRTGELDRVSDLPASSWPGLLRHEKELIFNEEVTAWDNARELLGEDFDAWGAYDEKRETSLAVYRTMLALDLEPVDGLTYQ
jgi:hypothetical protein